MLAHKKVFFNACFKKCNCGAPFIFVVYPSLSGSFTSRIFKLDYKGSFSHAFFNCYFWQYTHFLCPLVSGSLRQSLTAFGALHFTSVLFTIAVFLTNVSEKVPHQMSG